MTKIRTILLDAAILFAVSTVFVIAADFAFSGLKRKIPKDDPVVTAIGQGEWKPVEEILEKAQSDPTTRVEVTNRTDEHGRTSLMRAAYANFSDTEKLAETDDVRRHMVESLLAHGSAINATDKDGWNALMWASWSGLPKVADTLLGTGADVAAKDKLGNTALMIAARRGHADIVSKLLAKGADKNARNNAGLSAIDEAVRGMKEHPPKFYKDLQDSYLKSISALR
ncbi:MAG: ankyrin repeat domain-containing protein [Verrucomicrobia bacterium]|nr:ankyrin repeat domain-containing protein [Verrucomicrobiota bacterium]